MYLLILIKSIIWLLDLKNFYNLVNKTKGGVVKQILAYSFFLLASLFMLAGTVYSQSGWFQQNPFPPNERLLAVTFTDSNTGTIVGTDGIILHTTNGGETWTKQSSGTTNHLRGVYFTDANTGTLPLEILAPCHILYTEEMIDMHKEVSLLLRYTDIGFK